MGTGLVGSVFELCDDATLGLGTTAPAVLAAGVSAAFVALTALFEGWELAAKLPDALTVSLGPGAELATGWALGPSADEQAVFAKHKLSRTRG